ncbi:acriflavin resistance protein [Rhodomicrobium vannielii ATCC 17100]|uniref:Acriflavin resistance protein n=1 Tax=Rhodomicrobium vannielii (strain ATCC 17100 / DSM 162 / LMG 4299 / NCIMB 10020 / ATH 3.1.1) TaxID=648757 RepID=E3I672_RHOVT|nr:efflux RND transporter permease subunit [Rhodomicrobium vannielii]ADP71737.1 acriflavin resistance protein [Rhodomicrobium vannielii ATCC 17100]
MTSSNSTRDPSDPKHVRLGISGYLTRAFINSKLTPLILLAALTLGTLALVALPREEEPQISVPMVDIQVRADGLKAQDAERLVTEPLETIVKAINGVEHVYSQTYDDRVVVTARFLVGTKADEAILRVHEKVRANLDRIPVGIPEPLIVGRGIDDVAIMVLTLSPTPEAAPRWTEMALYHLAENLRIELAKVDEVGLTYLSGGRPDQIRIEPDPERLSLYGVTLAQLIDKVKSANRSFVAGQTRDGGRAVPVVAGQTLAGVPDVGLLLLTTRDGRPVYVRDVAKVVVDGKPVEARSWHYAKTADGKLERVPAVSIAIAKRAGANAVVIAERLEKKLVALKGSALPPGIDVNITRNYGATASDKADELLFHLGLATVSIVLLIVFAIGWREGLVVLVVIPTTILLTMFASWIMGYTINRVSLFALIFSIGILVDDAIVVIENIARHWAMRDGRNRMTAAIEAVAEVGNPTIIATLTVVVALLPMLFVSGLMGPYMSPIPANASAAMVFSFFVAVMVTPWLMMRIAGRAPLHGDDSHGVGVRQGFLARAYLSAARPILKTRGRSLGFLVAVGVATIAACSLFYFKAVSVKLLPFDNKSEVQVVLDLPEGSSLEDTDRALADAARRLASLPELETIQANAGSAAPFNFNGLVRHYYLRAAPELGDLQVNLTHRDERDRTSHQIALDIRERLAGLPLPQGSALKVVEVPPGPPVMATLLAEVYGPTPEARRETATKLKELFKSVPFIVDVDDSFGTPSERLRVAIDQDKLEFFHVEQKDVYDTVQAYLSGVTVGYSHRGEGRHPVEIAVALPKRDLAIDQHTLSTPVPANAIPGNRSVVELGDVVRLERERASFPIFRHNSRPAEMVSADLAGKFEAPIYGMLAVRDAIDRADWGPGQKPVIALHGQPDDETKPTLLWDGEWEVTYVTFRDMGAAFGIAILGIYFIVVGQFGSFKLPLVILTPVPLTLIGIVIGHWMFGAPFTATSMIGFIALAGIIVRNSILLVDFIRERRDAATPLRQVLLEAGAIRFKPILLTALAAMIGAAVILTDPIFQGLAISLLFGLLSSTLLTVLVIPAIYIVLRDDRLPEPEGGFPSKN